MKFKEDSSLRLCTLLFLHMFFPPGPVRVMWRWLDASAPAQENVLWRITLSQNDGSPSFQVPKGEKKKRKKKSVLNDNKRLRELEIITFIILKGNHRKKPSEVCVLLGTGWTCGQDGVTFKLSVCSENTVTEYPRLFKHANVGVYRVYKCHPKKAKQRRNEQIIFKPTSNYGKQHINSKKYIYLGKYSELKGKKDQKKSDAENKKQWMPSVD